MAPRRILFAERRPVESLKLSERARIRNREIGFISQAINLLGDITVYENVEPPLTSWGSTEGNGARWRFWASGGKSSASPIHLSAMMNCSAALPPSIVAKSTGLKGSLFGVGGNKGQ